MSVCGYAYAFVEMAIRQLRIKNVRNIHQQSIEFSPGLNVLGGRNGSGKTSILEAINILGTGKSFRANQVHRVISHGEKELLVHGKLERENQRLLPVGVRRGREDWEIKVGSEQVKTFSVLAKQLPLMVITPDSHKLLEAGPSWRRRYVDWGVFHVEHQFGTAWAKYSGALKQRNALLQAERQGASSTLEHEYWLDTLVREGELLASFRQTYIEQLRPFVQRYTDLLLHGHSLDVELFQGWREDISLLELLKKQTTKDRMFGYTESGPHKSDLRIRFDKKEAKSTVSRGQQKLLVYAMRVAQIAHLYESSNKQCTLLLDDIGAELDKFKLDSMLSLVEQEFSQVILTTATPEMINIDRFSNAKLFHVEHGAVENVNFLH